MKALRSRMPRWVYHLLRPAVGSPNSFFNPARYKLWKRRPYLLGYLAMFDEEDAIGPLQRDEALLMYAIVKVLRPKVILEFGFYLGHSSYNFLRAAGSDTHVFSFDVTEVSRLTATRYFSHYQNFRYLHKSQVDFDVTDVEGMRVDMLFIDASHSLSHNIETFDRVLPVLDKDAVVVIHDTGTWAKRHCRPVHKTFAASRTTQWLNGEEFVHQPEERDFVNYIGETYPEFQQIHLHSLNTLRHGLTIMQKSKMLVNESQGTAGE